MSGFPIQLAKVQPPPLRDDILSRERLNSWLDARVTRRVVLITAEAGYGKTTLLADWSRGTSRRTLWYRLDPDDRDWLTFLTHLVASGRQLDPAFGEESQELLGSLGPGGPTRDAIVTALVRELSELSAEGGATLIFDDFHAVDENDDIIQIVRSLIDRTADSLSFIIASRHTTQIPLSRIRTQNVLTQLRSQELRFAATEADELFRYVYARPLEPDVLAELIDRTEGWAASLQLVRTVISERSPLETRLFVRRLSGARGDVHDYLAEEVLTRLPEHLQQFLMRTAVLATIHLESATVAFAASEADVAALLDQSVALGLLAGTAPELEAEYRFHPLVREFLESRVQRELGTAGLRDLHRVIASHFEGRDWRLAATHYRESRDRDAVLRVVTGAIDEILGRGEYAAALELVQVDDDLGIPGLILKSRLSLQRGDIADASSIASRAVDESASLDPSLRARALMNMASIMFINAEVGRADGLITELLTLPIDASKRGVAEAMAALGASGADGDFGSVVATLERLLAAQVARREEHYVGVTHVNIASILVWMERPDAVLRHAALAEEALERSSGGFERLTATLLRARAMAELGDWRSAEESLGEALDTRHPLGRIEAVIEALETHGWFGDTSSCEALLADSERLTPQPGWHDLLDSIQLLALLRLERQRDHPILAACIAADQAPQTSMHPATLFRRRFSVARCMIALGDSSAGRWVKQLQVVADRQGAATETTLSRLLTGVVEGPESLNHAVRSLLPRQRYALSVLAEEVASLGHRLGSAETEVVGAEIHLRPQRWSSVLRNLIDRHAPSSVWASRWLGDIGDASDISRLRGLTRSNRASASIAHVDRLIRRVSPRIFIEDLGRLQIFVGSLAVSPSRVRRKVAALLCYLLTHPRLAATREQVLEAMWPELGPDAAANSLNQTIYYLRRVFEPRYSESTSPAYVHYESEMVWLDEELVDSASRRMQRRIERCRQGASPELLTDVLDTYRGRFAEEFAYEEWTAGHRDTLHASFLQVAEQLMGVYAEGDAWQSVASVAQRVLAIDPNEDHVEATLLRAYRAMGANAAAAEQYSHYSSLLRVDLGIDPPPIGEV